MRRFHPVTISLYDLITKKNRIIVNAFTWQFLFTWSHPVLILFFLKAQTVNIKNIFMFYRIVH